MTKFVIQEKEANESVRKIREEQQAKYKLESFIYQTKDKIKSAKFGIFAEDSLKQAFEKEAISTESWLYADGAHSFKDEYIHKLKSLEKLVEKFTIRLSKIEESTIILEEVKTYFNNALNEFANDIKIGT